MKEKLSAIVAVAEDGAIGRNGDLLCHMSADLKHFKNVTTGGTVVMGRRTYDSLPKGALPNRRNIVITRNPYFTAKRVETAHSLAEALQLTKDDEKVFVIGGEQIYRATFDSVSTLYLTRIHARFPDADAFFPEINPSEWRTVSEESFPADEKNPYPYTFLTLERL